MQVQQRNDEPDRITVIYNNNHVNIYSAVNVIMASPLRDFCVPASEVPGPLPASMICQASLIHSEEVLNQ